MGEITVRKVYGQVLLTDKRPITVRKVYAQTLSVSIDPINVRAVRAQYVTIPQDPVNLRVVRAQYLSVPKVPPDFSKPPLPLLLAKVNGANGTYFTEEQVTFGAPAPLVGGTRNTQLNIHAEESSRHSGDVTIQYDRWDLGEVFGLDAVVNGESSGFGTVHELLPLINEQFKLCLTPEEVVDHPVDSGGAFVLQVNDKSIYFLPNSLYTFGALSLANEFPVTDLGGFEVPPKPDISELFPVSDLDGFNLPDIATRFTKTDLDGFSR